MSAARLRRRSLLAAGLAAALAPRPAAAAPAPRPAPARPGWTHRLPRGAVRAAPARGGDLVALVQVRSVVALAAADGRERWRVPLADDADDDAGIALVVSGDRVIVCRTEPADGGQRRATVSALRAADGAPAWTARVRGPVTPGVRGGTLLLECGWPRDAYVQARDPGTGAVRWNRRAAALGAAEPVRPADPLVPVAVELDTPRAGCHLLDAATGDARWRSGRVAVAAADLAPGGGYLAALTATAGEAELIRLARATGGPEWAVPVTDTRAVRAGAAHVVTVTGGGEVAARDPATGAVRWRWVAPAPLRDPAVLLPPGVVLVWGEERLYPLDAATGAPLPSPLGAVEWRPALDAAALYAISGRDVVALPLGSR
ncbi:hypothetical protein GCM10010123_36780 [Pilimelia anulata]|uniref:Pyrrolo-quinoline quinone repeat domain-containing protein n=1 Tax=Pilimelia anulata TaxID=53371 RepID=A0A8J3B8P1_9ACTN|nr:PQQ-binding-like beta-propeller repeat protein [Pilimelia anulata]GGK03509.1 hypothetical protein GCM10010123_36780 [Pilimelia anulata]